MTSAPADLDPPLHTTTSTCRSPAHQRSASRARPKKNVTTSSRCNADVIDRPDPDEELQPVAEKAAGRRCHREVRDTARAAAPGARLPAIGKLPPAYVRKPGFPSGGLISAASLEPTDRARLARTRMAEASATCLQTPAGEAQIASGAVSARAKLPRFASKLNTPTVATIQARPPQRDFRVPGAGRLR